MSLSRVSCGAKFRSFGLNLRSRIGQHSSTSSWLGPGVTQKTVGSTSKKPKTSAFDRQGHLTLGSGQEHPVRKWPMHLSSHHKNKCSLGYIEKNIKHPADIASFNHIQVNTSSENHIIWLLKKGAVNQASAWASAPDGKRIEVWRKKDVRFTYQRF